MNFVDSIIHNRLEEAKRIIFERLDELATEKWEDAKAYLVNDMFEEVEVEDTNTNATFFIFNSVAVASIVANCPPPPFSTVLLAFLC